LVSGVLGSAVTVGGDLAGYQSLAAKIAGGMLIFMGLSRLLLLLPFMESKPLASPRPSRIAGLLQKAKPLIASRGPNAQAYLGGLVTTWLPCGWLYLFVLVAAGTGAVVPALAVMAAFWVGTVPALTALTVGARSLIPRFRTLLPIAASILLIVTGLYTATGRASADLSAMVPARLDPQGDVTSLMGLADQPLPCCQP
jgi:hypothetical protein